MQFLPTGLGSRPSPAFPIPFPVRYAIQFLAVDILWLRSSHFEMAKSTDPRPGYVKKGRRHWLPGSPAATKSQNLSQAHTRVSGESLRAVRVVFISARS